MSEESEKRRLMRLSWFSGGDKNENLEKDGFFYFKHWEGRQKVWVVDQFTPDSFKKMQSSYKEFMKFKKGKEMENTSRKLIEENNLN